MSDNTGKLYEAMAKAKIMREHAEECGKVISRKAGEWLPGAQSVYDKMAKGDVSDPLYNGAGALGLARGIGVLRRLRDGS
jgi:hypothetical protein